MFPATPPAHDITRPRLREIAYWIRDELDPIVAREGPDHLRADDVLILHDIFQALRTSTTITCLDLRATGIHKAVMDVSGMATRWPGRLCDDCDKVISAWTAKFGRLQDLRPFLYGRGGQLEGIASVEDSTKQALIKRWQASCPEKISPKRSRKHGDLGFRAGDWWINPLFACHAGIICLDSAEGGICYDKNGAYAILLKDTGEIEAPSESNFRYRCGRNDRGRFRLTAATAKSRSPIRVLRSHSMNSIWGPKAGVRFEGLYNVKGWSVHTIKKEDISSDEFRLGDIVYDVLFIRDDPVPMDEVAKHPTTFQIDEYTEYKRLRKAHREMQRKGENGKPETEPHTMKIAPPIAPLVLMSPLISTKFPQIASRTSTIKRPMNATTRSLSSPSNPSSPQEMLGEMELSRGPTMDMLKVPTPVPTRPTAQTHKPESSSSGVKSASASKQEFTPSNGSSQSHTSVIREVAPWVDYELEPIVQAGESIARAGIMSIPGDLEKTRRVSRKSTQSLKAENNLDSKYSAGHSLRPPKSIHEGDVHDRGRRGGAHTGTNSSNEALKECRKHVFKDVRSRNPIAKLFDGAGSIEDEADDYFSHKRRATSESPKGTATLARERRRASSSHEMPLSPIPVQPISPNSPLLRDRRDAICLPYGYVVSPGTPSINLNELAIPTTMSIAKASQDVASPRSIPSVPFPLPVSLQSLISKPKPMPALTTLASSPHTNLRTRDAGVDEYGAADGLRRYMEGMRDGKIAFRNPFGKKDGETVVRGQGSSDVAPDVVG